MRFHSPIFLMLGLLPLALAQSPLSTTSGTGFAGTPYSATETTTVEASATEGLVNTNPNVTLLWRDADGRTRQEHKLQVSSGVEHRAIVISDPVAGVYLKWTVGNDIAVKTATIWPLDPKQRVTARISSLPPLSAASGGITSCGPGCTREGRDLQEINGIPALGFLTKRIVAAGAGPNAEDLVNTNELWTSPELRIIVRHIMGDPRTGVTTTNVTDIVRGDPDPGLFRIPDGYQVQDMTASAASAGTGNGESVADLNQENGAGLSAAATPPRQLMTGETAGNRLSGSWVNENPGTGGLVRIEINGLNIHPFGACHPSPCDWGIVLGKNFAGSVDSSGVAAMTAQVVTSFSETTLTLARETDERLRVDAFTQFTDQSNRADYHSTDYFRRDLRPAPIAAQQPQPAVQSPIQPGGNQVLVVWKAGSPASNQVPDSNVPLNLERKAESMGLRLQVRAFAGSEFAQEFRNAFAAHQEPDIIAIENAASIHGGGPYNPGVGIASDPDVRKSLIQVNGSLQDLAGPRGGWQYLISTSQHAEAARRLALRAPDCDVLFTAPTPVPPELQKAALEIAGAYLRTPTEMKDYNDADRLMTEGARWDSVNARETRTCGSWGNDRLAFVSLVSTFEHEDFDKQPPPRSLAHGPLIGQMPILLVLRKQGAGWRLLAASSNPMWNSAFLFQFPAISRLLHKSGMEETGVAPAQLLSPENGHAPIREAGQRFGNFTWQPSPSGNVVTQIVEFAYQNDDWLNFVPTKNDATPDQWSAGSVSTAAGEWKWRVWSISDTGAIAFSDYRTFRQ